MMSAPVARTWSVNMALTVAAVPTGMKAGVRMLPRDVAISPRRAPPSCVVRMKLKGAVMRASSWAGQPCKAVFGGPEQRRVAIGIEAVTAGNGVGISVFHGLQAGKGRHQHEQRRARQVEIRQQQIDGFEAVA